MELSSLLSLLGILHVSWESLVIVVPNLARVGIRFLCGRFLILLWKQQSINVFCHVCMMYLDERSVWMHGRVLLGLGDIRWQRVV